MTHSATDGVQFHSVAVDGWASRTDDARISLEMRTLVPYFPEFRWYRWEGSTFTEGPLRTNRGVEYAIRVTLPADFPSHIPCAQITTPRPLRDFSGRHLTNLGSSTSMHLLEPHDDLPVICHHRPATWGPHLTVYQVVMKARLWLEAYQMHLATGRPIDTWLGHAEP